MYVPRHTNMLIGLGTTGYRMIVDFIQEVSMLPPRISNAYNKYILIDTWADWIEAVEKGYFYKKLHYLYDFKCKPYLLEKPVGAGGNWFLSFKK